MNKKQYMAPKLCIELYKVVQNVMWAGSGGKVNGMDPGGSAPTRNGEGTSVKLTKMYI